MSPHLPLTWEQELFQGRNVDMKVNIRVAVRMSRQAPEAGARDSVQERPAQWPPAGPRGASMSLPQEILFLAFGSGIASSSSAARATFHVCRQHMCVRSIPEQLTRELAVPGPRRAPCFPAATSSLMAGTPAMIGCSFVVNRKFFGEIGLLDPGMDVYGGENIELGIKVGEVASLPPDVFVVLRGAAESPWHRRLFSLAGRCVSRVLHLLEWGRLPLPSLGGGRLA
ncbi:Hypothetical predicted protein [Marmota monax]|uniref:Galactosyltransferase C-terminal domain-containing protein n=1 Tax=Marmota monax TaxID=9995 RepID=A0A5E4AD44_MARMO|nr:Hypothetical predicted protein [Marmota monax]